MDEGHSSRFSFIGLARKSTELSVIFLFVAIVAIVFLQVVLRYVFNSPPCWTEEIARYAQVWMIMLTSSICLRKGSHLAVDYLSTSFSPAINKGIKIFINLLIMSYIPILFFFGIKLCSVAQFQFSAAMQIRMLYIYLIFPISAVLLFIESFVNLFDSIKEK